MHIVCALWNKDVDNTVEPYPVPESRLNKQVSCLLLQTDLLMWWWWMLTLSLYSCRLADSASKRLVYVSVAKSLIVQSEWMSMHAVP